MSLYSEIASKIVKKIDLGQYRPGEKIPSVRQMSQKLDVSISTVLMAYDLLEGQGYIEARPQSGYFVRSRSTVASPKPGKSKGAPIVVPASSTEVIYNVIRSCGSRELYPLGAAVIHHDFLPTESLSKALAHVSRRHAQEINRYGQGIGRIELREQISKRSLDYGCEFSPEDVIITNGCMEAVYLSLLSTTKHGDTVAIETPTYFGFIEAIHSLGLKAIEIPSLHDAGIDLEQLESALDKFEIKALLLCPNFSNPTGSQVPIENQKRIISLSSKHGFVIIEDDIFAELSYQDKRPKLLKSFDPDHRVITCSSFSKTLAPGFRVGWIIATGPWKEKIERLKSSLSGAAQTSTQLAIAYYLQHSNYEKHLRRLRQQLKINLERTSDFLIKHFPQNIKFSQPKGGSLLWVELPTKYDTVKLHHDALAKKISVIPGVVFSISQKYRNYMRINFGNTWSDDYQKSLLTIAELIRFQE